MTRTQFLAPFSLWDKPLRKAVIVWRHIMLTMLTVSTTLSKRHWGCHKVCCWTAAWRQARIVFLWQITEAQEDNSRELKELSVPWSWSGQLQIRQIEKERESSLNSLAWRSQHRCWETGQSKQTNKKRWQTHNSRNLLCTPSILPKDNRSEALKVSLEGRSQLPRVHHISLHSPIIRSVIVLLQRDWMLTDTLSYARRSLEGKNFPLFPNVLIWCLLFSSWESQQSPPVVCWYH